MTKHWSIRNEAAPSSREGTREWGFSVGPYEISVRTAGSDKRVAGNVYPGSSESRSLRAALRRVEAAWTVTR